MLRPRGAMIPAVISRRCLCHALAAIAAGTATAQTPSPQAIAIPRWFSNSLLDFQDEVPEAERAGKRVMIYFGQDGCPYCKALIVGTFASPPVVEKMRRHFAAVAVNIWGDLDVTWTDGRRFTEKTFARELKVQFTPTLLFVDAGGRSLVRLNGYQPPERFEPVLDYLIERRDRVESLADFLARREPQSAQPLKAQPYLLRDASNLSRRAGGKPLAVLFETPSCKACAEMHAEAFTRPALRQLLGRFDVARIVAGSTAQLRAPDGASVGSAVWARDLGIAMHPTVVFFDDRGAEVFRFDGYLRPFHIESAFAYVADRAYRSEPQFQRYVQARAERLREGGKPVDLWR